MADKLLYNIPHGNTIVLNKNSRLDKQKLEQTVKKMETKLANRCAKKILKMEANWKTISHMDIIAYNSKKEKIFWLGVPELNIESPFLTVKNLLKAKGYILIPDLITIFGWREFCIKCKNI